MAQPDETRTSAQRLGIGAFRICRGAAVAVLGLGIYVGLTNWEGSGSVWAFRYAGIAVAIFLVGLGLRALLNRT